MPDRIRNYFLGGPIFSNAAWRGTFFTKQAKTNEFLVQYSQALNAVEGNSTFYGLPSSETVERWRDQLPDDFQFCFKFPRSITHEGSLLENGKQQQTEAFLKRLAPLSMHTRLWLLQLPPSFGAKRLSELERYVRSLGSDIALAIEPRHADFFDNGSSESEFDDLLRTLHADRALFDTATLHAIPPQDDSIREAQRKKPKFASRLTRTGSNPFLRFVGHNEVTPNHDRLTQIAAQAANWIREGHTPFVFLHCPDDLNVPLLCSFFHQQMHEELGEEKVGRLGNWPGEVEEVVTQRELF